MSRMAVNNASVAVDISVILTMVAENHHVRYASQIHALQIVNALFKKMANQFVPVHSEWEEILRQTDVMVMNVMLIVIVQKIMLASDSDVVIHVQAHVALEQTVKLRSIIQFVIVTMV